MHNWQSHNNNSYNRNEGCNVHFNLLRIKALLIKGIKQTNKQKILFSASVFRSISFFSSLFSILFCFILFEFCIFPLILCLIAFSFFIYIFFTIIIHVCFSLYLLSFWYHFLISFFLFRFYFSLLISFCQESNPSWVTRDPPPHHPPGGNALLRIFGFSSIKEDFVSTSLFLN